MIRVLAEVERNINIVVENSQRSYIDCMKIWERTT